MKTLSLTLACLAAAALVSFTQAEEVRKIKLIIDGSPEAGQVKIETDDLALGETRSFTSEKGRPVLVTRTENGFEIDVDGKKTVVDLPPAGGDGFEFQTFDEPGDPTADGQPRKRVIVKKMGGGPGHILIHEGDAAIDIESGEIDFDPQADGKKQVRIIRLDDGHGKNAEAKDGQATDGRAKDGEAKKVHVVVRPGADLAAARAKLIQSGALEGLDAATRQRILAALGEN